MHNSFDTIAPTRREWQRTSHAQRNATRVWGEKKKKKKCEERFLWVVSDVYLMKMLDAYV